MRFKILGTEIYVSFFFAAVIAFMLAVDRTGLVIPTLFASFIHETGHLFAMWVAECQPKRIRLIPSSVQITRGFAKKKGGEIAISICGPAANVAVFLVLILNYCFIKDEKTLNFALLNLILAVFNMLPVSGLDGGDILYEIILKKSTHEKALMTVRTVTAVLSVALFICGVYMWVCGKFNLSVFIVAVYLFIGCIIKK